MGLKPKERLEEARADAEFAFWEAVAQKFPEIETGDMDPMVVFEMHTKMEEWIAIWLNANGNFPLTPKDYGEEHLCDWCGENKVAAGVKNCDVCLKGDLKKCPLCKCTEAHACEDCNEWVICSECKREVCDGKKCAVQSPYNSTWLCQECNTKKVI